MNKDKQDTDRMDMGCLEAIEALYAYLDGELKDPKSIEDFEHHMSHCRSCYSRADIENLLTDRLRAASGSHASERLKKRLRNLIDEF